ncbi:hypothetical protein, partial [Limnofasciculus baicalensis]
FCLCRCGFNRQMTMVQVIKESDWKSRLHKQSPPSRTKIKESDWKSRLHKQSPPSRTKIKLVALKPAEAGFVCVDAVLTAR